MGPKSRLAGAFFAEDEAVGDVTDVDGEDVGVGVVPGADCAASGCGGGAALLNDFATSTPPTSRRTAVTAAAIVPRRSPNRGM